MALDQTTIQKLKNYFASRDDVSMAFLFGSQAKGTTHAESDVDVGVYFTPQGRRFDLEENKEYPNENKIFDDVERVTNKKVDLTVLNQAPAGLAFSIVNEGVPIIVKDRGVYLDFLLASSDLAEDFRNFTFDWWAIRERSHSLTDQDKQRLIERLAFVENELTERDKFKAIDQRTFMDENNRSPRRDMERWAENILNATIDISKIMLASEKKSIPQTSEDNLRMFGYVVGFDEATVETFASWGKFRNSLAHDYLDIRFSKLYKFIDAMEQIYPMFLKFVKSALNQ